MSALGTTITKTYHALIEGLLSPTGPKEPVNGQCLEMADGSGCPAERKTYLTYIDPTKEKFSAGGLYVTVARTPGLLAPSHNYCESGIEGLTCFQIFISNFPPFPSLLYPSFNTPE